MNLIYSMHQFGMVSKHLSVLPAYFLCRELLGQGFYIFLKLTKPGSQPFKCLSASRPIRMVSKPVPAEYICYARKLIKEIRRRLPSGHRVTWKKGFLHLETPCGPEA